MNYKGQRIVARGTMKTHYQIGDKGTVVDIHEEEGTLSVVLDKTSDKVSTVIADNFVKDKEEPYIKRAYKYLNEEEEESHVHLDALLCEVLKKEGYTELVNIFEKAPKWYS